MALTSKFLDKSGLSTLWSKIKSTFVAQEEGKGLYPDEDKTKLAGIADGANKYILPEATDQVLGGVKQGAGISIAGGVASVNYETIEGAPKKVSDLNNDLKFQSDTDVSSAISSALASGKYQTEDQVKAAIEAGQFLTRKIVESLPEDNQSDKIIYLIAKTTSKGNQAYDEFMWINNAWEKVGDTEVSLDGYVKEDDIQAISSEELDEILV